MGALRHSQPILTKGAPLTGPLAVQLLLELSCQSVCVIVVPVGGEGAERSMAGYSTCAKPLPMIMEMLRGAASTVILGSGGHGGTQTLISLPNLVPCSARCVQLPQLAQPLLLDQLTPAPAAPFSYSSPGLFLLNPDVHLHSLPWLPRALGPSGYVDVHQKSP